MKCFVCEEVIPKERVDFLAEMGVAIHNLTCVKHSITQRKKGLFEDEAGTSRLIICDEIRDVNIRSILKEDNSEIESDGVD